MKVITKKYRIKFCCFLLTALVLSSCNPARRVPNGQYLLDHNRVKVEGAGPAASEVEHIIKQKPNKRLLGVIRFHLWMYNITSGRKTSKVKDKVRSVVGEPPVILDSSLVDLSAKQIRLYLRNSGYLDAEVSYETRIKGGGTGKKAVVTYNLLPLERYMIGEYNRTITDSTMRRIIEDNGSESLIYPGVAFDAELLDDERDRITRELRENGYFFFLPDFIYYQADTTLGEHKVALEMIIKDLALEGQSVPWNHQCRIKNIYVHIDENIQNPGTVFDTTLYYDMYGEAFTRIYFITGRKDYFKSTIGRCVFMKQGELYNIGDAEKTYNRISELKNFKYINIRFTLLDSVVNKGSDAGLKCDIYLTSMLRRDYAIETEVTNSAGDPGLAASLVYRNRNLMKGAEILSLRFYGALEVQNISDDLQSESVINGLPFNTLESGVDFGLDVPKFLVPFKATGFPKYFRPKSTVKVGFNYQERPDYKRYVALTSYGYQWRQTGKISHTLTPIEVSSIKIFPDSLFRLRIEALKDAKLRMQYKDHLIVSMNYSLIYNSQQINQREDFTYARFSVEVAGNGLRLMNNILGTEMNSDNSYTLFNIRYAQYFRGAIDFRQYWYNTPKTTLAYRTSLGIGIPYGNQKVLPFEKSFYAGGANGIRAWPLRTLGPGSYRDTSGLHIDRIGDLSIESSFEYRFKIYKFFEGAAFVDAGNIWLTWPSQEYVGGDFRFSRFYKEFAIGAGLGLRLDLSFFILRLDAALPIKDPSYPTGERWRVSKSQLKDLNWNFAIGYPF